METSVERWFPSPCISVTVAVCTSTRLLTLACVLIASPFAISGQPDPVEVSTEANGKLSGKLSVSESDVSFRNEIVPRLTLHGCNSGACHGSASGRGGLALSLYGSAPERDYDSIVRQLSGRRINLRDPSQSLILQKATESIEHGGKQIFADGSPSAEAFRDWVAAGARWDSASELLSLEVIPTKLVVQGNKDVSLSAVAHFADGSQRDVTRLTVFTADDKAAVKIGQAGVVAVNRPGRHIVIARYLNKVIPVELLRPFDREIDSSISEPELLGSIDRHVLHLQNTLGLRSGDRANDATLRRRLSLDLTGRLPTVGREKLDVDAYVDELIGSQAFSDYWTLQFSKMMRLRPINGDLLGFDAYERWLRQKIEGDFNYQSMARELVLASGDSHSVGQANFYRTVSGPRMQAEFSSELFMGTRLRCANCHDHPFDHWTQDDYHGLAAIFAKVSSGQQVQLNPRGHVTHPVTLMPAEMRLPDGRKLADSTRDPRIDFANWLTNDDNPFFAKALVNRLWKQLMGRGLIEPVDDIRDTNPATHPELLTELTNDFIRHGYDFRRTIKLIACSDTYARRSLPLNQMQQAQFYTHRIAKPMPPEVLADAISDVIGLSETYGESDLDARAVEIIDPTIQSRTLDVLGRCDRTASCEDDAGPSSGIAQKLYLINGEVLNARLKSSGNRIAELQKRFGDRNVTSSNLAIVDRFYEIALGRQLSESEQDYWTEQLEGIASDKDRRLWFEDFVWGLCNSREFLTIK